VSPKSPTDEMKSPHVKSLAREIGALRLLAANLEKRPLPAEELTPRLLLREGLGRVWERADGIIMAIRMPAHRSVTELTNCLLDRLPNMERGVAYSDIQTELLHLIETYLGRDASTIGSDDAEALIGHFEKWFADKAFSWRVFVPCVISPTRAPRFEIGPIKFEFIDRLPTSDFFQRGGKSTTEDRYGIDKLLEWMREGAADWLACVAVEGCERTRAEETAELAVDLTIVALQLAAPSLDTRSMTRLDARRGTRRKRTLSETNGELWTGWTRKEPGIAIGAGTLPDILQKAAPLFTAVGNMVRSFTSGTFRLPMLEQAWCDAAYWLHEALAERIDAIAIAKLETALEVLLRAENNSGSNQRLLTILNAFFDLQPEDPVFRGAEISARQFARNVNRDRSRILHGTWSTLSTRGLDREGMEGFVITVLRRAVVELEAYAHSPGSVDDTDQFLRWMQQRKTT
jgi:hypothetical protein